MPPEPTPIKTIKRAKWMPVGYKWVATDWCGQKTAFYSEPVPEIRCARLAWFTNEWDIGLSKYAINGPRVRPPKDPSKTLRRIV